MLVFIIQASPTEHRTHLGQLLIAFFKTFGQTFNYIATGISTKGDCFRGSTPTASIRRVHSASQLRIRRIRGSFSAKMHPRQ
jgi:hypothetical protein